MQLTLKHSTDQCALSLCLDLPLKENSMANENDSLISESAEIHETAVIQQRCLLLGDSIIVDADAKIEYGSVIGCNVVIGRGAIVRAGAVVFKSVPPNAIVEGNPARIVAYNSRRDGHTLVPSRIFAFQDIKGCNQRPCSVVLNVGNSAMFLMRQVTDSRGSLTVGEVPSEVPFDPKRYFAVYGVPSSELRGEHAHKECEQFLLCVNGSLRVLLDDAVNQCEVILDRPEMGVYMPAMIWGTQYQYSRDAVLLVFASMPYSSSDYIRDYEEFLSLKKLPSQ